MTEGIALVTDTNSGIMSDEAKALGVHVVPMPFVVDGEECFEDVSLSAPQFYARLAEGADIVTSQPSLVDLGKLWRDLLETYAEIIYIPMSSGLSGSCETAHALAEHFDGRVHVVDNQRISVTQREAVLDALRWVAEGRTAAEVTALLERTKLDASIYIMVDTLDYLRKGGRITPAVASIGSLLKIKPILQIQGEKLDAFAIAKSFKAAKRTMIKALATDIERRFTSVEHVHLYVAHTNRDEDAESFAADIRDHFATDAVHVARLPLSIACHVGPGALGIGCAKKQFA
ncbi:MULTISPECIES: DegV family protein [Gordonibacter]|uniref:DegV family protein n=1 Tax=Gordonibacter faecis TaxID=3047475 RepID=A0ABT7DLZ9_9ACTN|nr:DegV family protein [Gordonibacter sp. KGMB12511]MDJ1649591.1 DegV family protein [Gordonibacter sp. KGMB12511]HIW77255.1 DegV family protein [Candidatus Gordonibacter avicola]